MNEKNKARLENRAPIPLTGKLVFLKSFNFQTLGKKVINNATIDVNRMRIVISSSPRHIKDTLNNIKDEDRIIYLGK